MFYKIKNDLCFFSHYSHNNLYRNFRTFDSKKIIDLTANINNLQEIISLSLFWLIIFFIKNICSFLHKKYSLKHFLSVTKSVQKIYFSNYYINQ